MKAAAVVLGSLPSPSSNVLRLGPLRIHDYGLLIAIGVVVGVRWAERRWIRASILTCRATLGRLPYGRYRQGWFVPGFNALPTTDTDWIRIGAIENRHAPPDYTTVLTHPPVGETFNGSCVSRLWPRVKVSLSPR